MITRRKHLENLEVNRENAWNQWVRNIYISWWKLIQYIEQKYTRTLFTKRTLFKDKKFKSLYMKIPVWDAENRKVVYRKEYQPSWALRFLENWGLAQKVFRINPPVYKIEEKDIKIAVEKQKEIIKSIKGFKKLDA